MRISKQEDIPKVIELMNICFKDEIENGLELPTLSHLSSKVQNDEIVMIVEEEDVNVIAFALIQINSITQPVEIYMLAVDPGYRRNGIGTRLIESCLDLARGNDWKKVRMYTRVENVPMRKVLAYFGFIPEGYLRKEFLNRDLILYSYFF